MSLYKNTTHIDWITNGRSVLLILQNITQGSQQVVLVSMNMILMQSMNLLSLLPSLVSWTVTTSSVFIQCNKKDNVVKNSFWIHHYAVMSVINFLWIHT